MDIGKLTAFLGRLGPRLVQWEELLPAVPWQEPSAACLGQHSAALEPRGAAVGLLFLSIET